MAHGIKKCVCMIDCASNFYPLSMEIWAYFTPPFTQKTWRNLGVNIPPFFKKSMEILTLLTTLTYNYTLVG